MQENRKCEVVSVLGKISVEISPGKVSPLSRLKAASLVDPMAHDIVSLSLLGPLFAASGVQIVKAEIDGKSILPTKMGAEMPIQISLEGDYNLSSLCGPPPKTSDLDEISKWAAPLGLWKEAVAAIFDSPLGE